MELMVGETKLQELSHKHVLVVGMGGVGSFAAEFLVRAGIGTLTIIDGDCVDATNRNRQLPALCSTQGQLKVNIMQARLLDINPELDIRAIDHFIEPDAFETLLQNCPDYVLDAIDSISPKINCIRVAHQLAIPIVSSMGAGGKYDPTQLRVCDLSKTYNCPFAQQIRKQLKAFGITKGVKAVFSPEAPDKNSIIHTDGRNYKKSAYGTISYMPAMFGATAASVVLRDFLKVPIG